MNCDVPCGSLVHQPSNAPHRCWQRSIVRDQNVLALQVVRLRLKRRAINALLNGQHTNAGGNTAATCARNLLKIASAYSFSELLDEPGVGRLPAFEIQLWLEAHGASLRPAL